MWRYTEEEEFISGADPATDTYNLTLENTPLFYNDDVEGKWLEYLNIYDEEGNYYESMYKFNIPFYLKSFIK